ncbi:MAG: hypothetical protein V4568_01045 [Pseudomonadota bacterium]
MERSKVRLAILFSLAVITISSVATASSINFKSTEAYPESVAFDSKKKDRLVSSMHHGTIGGVTLAKLGELFGSKAPRSKEYLLQPLEF